MRSRKKWASSRSPTTGSSPTSAARSSPVGGATLYVAGELGAPKGEQAVAVQRRGFPAGTLVGTSGLELAFETRLAGQPGGELMAVGGQGGTEAERVLGAADPVEGEPVRTTINPDIQEATAAALGNTPAVAKSSYIDPEVFARFEAGATIGLTGSRERALLDLLR